MVLPQLAARRPHSQTSCTTHEVLMPMTSINDYLRRYGSALGHRVLEQFPPLHSPEDPLAEELRHLKRRPFPAQVLAIMGIVKRWRAGSA